MGIRIPSNKIQSKYTSGNELMFKETYREYKGHYYEMNGNLYAGKEFSSTAPELMKINSPKVNRLLTNPATIVYGKVSNIKIPNSIIPSFIYQADKQTTRFVDRYFTKKTNVVPIVIKEISKETYNSVKNDPIYVSIMIRWDNEGSNTLTLENAEKQMSGIKKFLEEEDDTLDSFGN
jgi:hypothetical protein